MKLQICSAYRHQGVHVGAHPFCWTIPLACFHLVLAGCATAAGYIQQNMHTKVGKRVPNLHLRQEGCKAESSGRRAAGMKPHDVIATRSAFCTHTKGSSGVIRHDTETTRRFPYKSSSSVLLKRSFITCEPVNILSEARCDCIWVLEASCAHKNIRTKTAGSRDCGSKTC